MAAIEKTLYDLGRLDDLARGDSPIHRLAPLTKTLVAAAFLVFVISFPKYGLTGLVPFTLYPAVLIALGGLPPAALFRRLLPALPFVLCVSVFNPILDQKVVLFLGSLPVTGGWLSLVVILLKFTLCVLAALILAATTSLEDICSSLARLGLPRVLAGQLLFTYRYLRVLGEEAARTARAHNLRAPDAGGIPPRAWGSLAGRLLLRTYDRAQRIHQAMICRGFTGEIRPLRPAEMKAGDAAFLFLWTAFFAAARLYDLPRLIGRLLEAV